MSEKPRDCEHGQHARVCRICELERELAAITNAARALLTDYDAGAIFNQEAGLTTVGWPEMEAIRAVLRATGGEG